MNGSSLLICGARIIDPANGFDGEGFVSVRDGRVESCGHMRPGGDFDQTLGAEGQWLIPGLIDLAARLREPGQSGKGTLRSESRAALAGGITTLVLPPDTRPVIDSPAVLDWLRSRVAELGDFELLPLGALTRGLEGRVLAEMAALSAAGCIGVSQAMAPLDDSLLMRRALEYAATLDLSVHIVPMSGALADNGCAHEGAVATRLGLPAIPVAAETTAMAQWLALAETTGARLHFGRLSSARATTMLIQAQSAGLPVTADVAMHALWLSDADLEGFDPHCHVIPPLRAAEDRAALRHAVASGAIGAICSDHQPHEADAKTNPFPLTEAGISGVDTLLSLGLELVHQGMIEPADLVRRLTSGPARILRRASGSLAPGVRADFVLLDPQARWDIGPQTLLSRGRNTPFLGRSLRGRVLGTWFSGRRVFER